MFFRTLVALTLSLAIIGIPQIGFSNEPDFEIEQEDLFAKDIFHINRPIIITSNYMTTIRTPKTVLVPEMFWPTDGEEVNSDFGYRRAPCSSCSSYHEGIDFTRDKGTPVYATLDGMISRIEKAGEYGLHIYIEHIATINTKTERWESVYAHLDSVEDELMVGNIVEGGTQIGTVGRTGLATGHHLHFELRVEGEKVDPEHYLLMYAN